MNTSPKCNEIEDRAHVGATKMGFCSSMDSESKHRSTLDFDSTYHEAHMHSSSMKSETSAETQRNHAVAVQDGVNATESSCSNSTVMVPLSFSNKSTSREAHLFRNCGSSMDSSNSKTFDRSPEELVSASSESDVSAQIASKPIGNASVRNSVKVLPIDGNHSPSMMGSKVMDKNKDGFWVIESADSSMTKCGEKAVKDEPKVIGFDLNEDINADEVDDCVHPVLGSASSHSVIHAVAKVGIPCGQPMKPLKFEGELGWKGAGETSAFWPTSLPKNLNGNTCSTNHKTEEPEQFAGIDLNVAFVEDTSHSEVDQNQAKRPLIDLNCLYDGVDDSTQPFIPPKSENPHLVDLNLDSNASLAERSNNAHGLGNSFPNLGMRDFSLPMNVYFTDLRTMQLMANNVQTLTASPHILQSMEQRIASQILPPHGFGNSYNTPYPTYIPKFDGRNEDHLSTSGRKIDGPRLFPFLSKDSPSGEPMHQESWLAESLKRKEPEGGKECYQFGYK